MTLPNKGVSLSLNQIQTEFGGDVPTSLTEYYGGKSYVPNSIVNQSGQAIPRSGTISIDDFYGTNKNQPNHTIQSLHLSSTNYSKYITYTISVELDRINLTGSTLSFTTTLYVDGVANGNIVVNVLHNSKSASITPPAVDKLPTTGTPANVNVYVKYGTVQSNSVPVSLEYYDPPPVVSSISLSISETSTTYTPTITLYTDKYNNTGSPIQYTVTLNVNSSDFVRTYYLSVPINGNVATNNGPAIPKTGTNSEPQSRPFRAYAGGVYSNTVYAKNEYKVPVSIQSVDVTFYNFTYYYQPSVTVLLNTTNSTGSPINVTCTVYVKKSGSATLVQTITVSVPNGSNSATKTGGEVQKTAYPGLPQLTTGYAIGNGTVQSSEKTVYYQYDSRPPNVTSLDVSSNNGSITGAGPITITFRIYTDRQNLTGSSITYNVASWAKDHNNNTSQGPPVYVKLGVNAGITAYDQLNVTREFNNGTKLYATVWSKYGGLTSNQITIQTTY